MSTIDEMEESNKLLKALPKYKQLAQNIKTTYSLILLADIGKRIGVTDDDLANDSLETRELGISALQTQRKELSDAFANIISAIDMAIDTLTE